MNQKEAEQRTLYVWRLNVVRVRLNSVQEAFGDPDSLDIREERSRCNREGCGGHEDVVVLEWFLSMW